MPDHIQPWGNGRDKDIDVIRLGWPWGDSRPGGCRPDGDRCADATSSRTVSRGSLGEFDRDPAFL